LFFLLGEATTTWAQACDSPQVRWDRHLAAHIYLFIYTYTIYIYILIYNCSYVSGEATATRAQARGSPQVRQHRNIAPRVRACAAHGGHGPVRGLAWKGITLCAPRAACLRGAG